MFTSLTETNPASESRNPLSKSFVFNDSSINDGEYFVAGIWAGEEVILLSSNSDGIEKITSALPNYASIFGQIYKVRTISGGRSGKLQYGLCYPLFRLSRTIQKPIAKMEEFPE
jgi:hypothetical protein